MSWKLYLAGVAILVLGFLSFYYAPAGGTITNSTLEPITRTQ